jgi:hypothetical protein
VADTKSDDYRVYSAVQQLLAHVWRAGVAVILRSEGHAHPGSVINRADTVAAFAQPLADESAIWPPHSLASHATASYAPIQPRVIDYTQ